MDTQVSERSALGTSAWDQVVIRGAIVLVVLLAIAAAGLRDLEAAAMTVGGIVGLALLRFRTGLFGRLGLALLGANVAFWMGAGAVSNLTHGEGFWETALPSALTLASVTTLIASVAAIVTRRRDSVGGNAPRIAQGVALAATIGVVLVAAVGTGSGDTALAGDIEIVTEDVKFSDTEIAADAGEIGVFVSNRDLFWHTFTIKELDVNVNVPVGGERRATFTAPAGTYEFVCAIPGHTQAGMNGTLTVR